MYFNINTSIFVRTTKQTNMEVFDNVFNKSSIYDTLFISIKSATEYKNVIDLKENNPTLFKSWETLCKTKYNISDAGIPGEDAYLMMLDDVYKDKGVYYPEFSKIVAILYGDVYPEDGQLKRNFHSIVNEDEFEIVKAFNSVLKQKSTDAVNSTPQRFPTLCGHNIISNDIPLYLKRLIHYRNKFESKNDLIPLILKNQLKAKPWEANIVDTLNVWKFNGVSNTPFALISDFMDLKRTVDLMDMNVLSRYYWDNIEEKPEETLKEISLQAATQTNLVIQMINELRLL